jgi:hypothetical protein
MTISPSCALALVSAAGKRDSQASFGGDDDALGCADLIMMFAAVPDIRIVGEAGDGRRGT